MVFEDGTGKKVTIGTVTLLVLGGGGYFASAQNPVYDILDRRYVTIASQNLETSFRIEDEIIEIDKGIVYLSQTGGDVTPLLVRKAVLEERLRRIERGQ